MMARNDARKPEDLDLYNFKACPDALETQIFKFFVISRNIKSKIIKKGRNNIEQKTFLRFVLLRHICHNEYKIYSG